MSKARRPRALVIAYDFPPHAAIGTMRTLRVVQQLAREEWDVTVLTSDPATFRANTPVDNALLARVPGDVRIVRARSARAFEGLKGLLAPAVKSGAPSQRRDDEGARPGGAAAPRQRSIVRRAVDVVDAALAIPDHESAWLMPAIVRGLAVCATWRPDVVYSSAPPWTGQLVARAVTTAVRCPWVADFRDPWARAPWRGDRFAFAMRAAAVLERSVVRRTDRIVFVARGNHDDFVNQYGPALASKFHVVANGCDPREFEGREHVRRDPAAPFVLLHAGSLYAGRTPAPLFGALATAVRRGIIDPQRFRVQFLGAVALQADLGALCRQLGLEGIVEFTPRVPRQASLDAMVSASGLLLLQPGHTVSVPGKVYEYLAAGRPIFAIAEEGETAALVRAGGGISVTPENEEAIVAAFEQFLRLADQPTVRPARELFDGNVRAAEIVRVLDAVIAKPGMLASAPASHGPVQ